MTDRLVKLAAECLADLDASVPGSRRPLVEIGRRRVPFTEERRLLVEWHIQPRRQGPPTPGVPKR